MEFGCGTGLVTVHIAKKVKSVLAVDNSAGMLDVLKQKIQSQAIDNVTPMQADLTARPELTGSFDFIYSCLTLHHIKTYQPVLEYFYTLLSPGGMIAIVDLDAEDGSFHSEDSQFEHTGFDRISMKKVLNQLEFEKIQDSTACAIPRERDGKIREYPLFLLTGQKI